MKRFVEVHYHVKDGKRSAFYQAILQQGIADAARAEEGNEKYDYFFCPENDNELVLLEIWRSPEDVQKHMETPHYKALGELKKEYVTETVFRRFDITELTG
ncbi:MAG: antibiotic biosynthesis monooxygenase [Oscillospiraceae bacterium]|nr:antibiotic biosynthesis monooxygenase [Oscillospiraceae bacterium]